MEMLRPSASARASSQAASSLSSLVLRVSVRYVDIRGPLCTTPREGCQGSPSADDRGRHGHTEQPNEQADVQHLHRAVATRACRPRRPLCSLRPRWPLRTWPFRPLCAPPACRPAASGRACSSARSGRPATSPCPRRPLRASSAGRPTFADACLAPSSSRSEPPLDHDDPVRVLRDLALLVVELPHRVAPHTEDQGACDAADNETLAG